MSMQKITIEFCVAAHGENLTWLNSIHCRKTVYETGDRAVGSKHDAMIFDERLRLLQNHSFHFHHHHGPPVGQLRALIRHFKHLRQTIDEVLQSAISNDPPTEEKINADIIRIPNDPHLREVNQYLHHILTRYDSLSDYTVFVQGFPFDQVSDVPGQVLANLCDFSTIPPSSPQPLTDQWAAGTFEFIKQITGREVDTTGWGVGQCWLASREYLRRHPASWYENLLAQCKTFPEIACVMERCWSRILE